MTSSSLLSRPSPTGGLRPALTPAPGTDQRPLPGEPIHKIQISTVSGDCQDSEMVAKVARKGCGQPHGYGISNLLGDLDLAPTPDKVLRDVLQA